MNTPIPSTAPRNTPERTARLLALLLSPCLIGCASSTFRAKDEGMVMPSGRIVAEVTPGRARGQEGDLGLGAEVRAGYLQSIEAHLTTVAGEDSRASGEAIEIGSTIFAPGTVLDSESRVSSIAAMAASGVRTETGLEFSVLYGLEYSFMDLDVESATQTDGAEHKEIGALIGLRLRWLVTEELRLYASSRISALRYSLQYDEFGVEYRVVPRLALFTGFRRTEYELDDDDDSEIDLRYKGIVAGIQLEF